ncbi:hypothetical protein, partial [Algoriphagus sp.]|uniref:hypothetical protein n=1 Tax=Algoriphagus sp. TaxID=1872435 RepID=UPI00262B6507
YFCENGSCVPRLYAITGEVYDADGLNALSNVLVKNSDGEILAISNNGMFTTTQTVQLGDMLFFEKQGYSTVTLVIDDITSLNKTVEMTSECTLDELVTCQAGEVCVGETCEPEFIYLAGYVIDDLTQEPIADVKVEPSGEFGGPIIFEKTDQSGYFMIKIKSGEDLYFSKTGYVAEVLPDLRVGSLDLLISLETGGSGIYCPIGSQEFYGECRFNCVSNQDCPPGTICVGDGLCLEPDDLCLVTNCPEGTVCYQGQCLEDPIIITGRVMDLNSLENLENVSISLASGGETLFTTSENGQYQVVIDSGEQLQFTAAGYSSITTDPILASNSNLVIEMETLECEGISCPPGYFCENGSCVPRLYAITGEVYDADGLNALSNVLVKNSDGEILAISNNGMFTTTQTVQLGDMLFFEKQGYSTVTLVIDDITSLNKTVEMTSECTLDELVTCQAGEVCVGETCEPEFIYLAGYVIDDLTQEPIADVKVEPSGEFGGPIIFEKTDQSGYFMIKIKSGEDLYFSKTGYVAEVLPDLRVGSLDLLISLETGGSGIYCPIGSQEFYGECRFNCVSNQDCP